MEISKAKQEKESKSYMDKLLGDETIQDLARKLAKELPKIKALDTFNKILLKHQLLPRRKSDKKTIKVSYNRFQKLIESK